MSLRLRIFLLFLVLISGALGFTLFIVNSNVRDAGDQRVFDSLAVGHKVFQEKIDSQLDNFEIAAKILGKEDALREAIHDDSLSLKTALGNFLNRLRQDYDADLLWLLELDGAITEQAGVSTTSGEFPYMQLLDRAESQDWSGRTIIPLDGHIYEIAIVGLFVPISAPLPAHWMIIGKALDDEVASELGELTELDIHIFGDGDSAAWVKSAVDSLPSASLATAHAQPAGTGFRLGIDNTNTLALKIRLESEESHPVYALLIKSDQEVQDQVQSLTTRLFFVGFVALLVSLVGAAFLSNSIARPLNLLVSVAQKIGRGEYSTSIPANLGGELGTLSKAFNTMQQDIAKRQEEIRYIAYHDTLTKLANRNSFIDDLAQAIQNADNKKQSFAVCIFDFDGFQDINNTLGRHNGDRVLIAFSQRLLNKCHDGIKIARLGGDEFALMILDVCAIDKEIANIKSLVNMPIEIERIALEIRLSVGISIYPDHGETPNSLLQTAEIAMYIAKRDGQDMAYYEKQRDHHSTQRLTLIAELRSAIEANQMVLHYQPKLDLKRNIFTHVECLVRWIHPTFGFINPDEFISYAEQTGAIRQLTHWVVNTALDQCRRWKDDGLDIKVAINISAVDLTQKDFAAGVLEMLEERELSAGDVVLEVTESALMKDVDLALSALEALRNCGVALSIDDYGTGYSSMAQLKRLPVDELKIDKSFVMNLHDDSDDYVIVKSTIELGHNMGLKLVAEGVETQAALDLLTELNCDLAQGYYLSRPLSPDHLDQWIAEHVAQISKISE